MDTAIRWTPVVLGVISGLCWLKAAVIAVPMPGSDWGKLVFEEMSAALKQQMRWNAAAAIAAATGAAVQAAGLMP